VSVPQEFVRDLPVPGLFRPSGLRAGFHAEPADPGSGLRHAGEQWAPARFLVTRHTHPVWELYLQLDGITRWWANGRPFTLAPGHLWGVAPRVPHRMVEESAGNHHFCFAGIDLAPVFARQPAFAARWRDLPPAVHRADAAALAEPFGQVMRELTATRAHPRQGLVLAVDRLVLEVTRLLAPGGTAAELVLHPAVARARALIDHGYQRQWRLGELAGAVGLAPTYLAGLFARELGVPPHQYLRDRRVRHAMRLLRTTDLPVSAIGVEVGFGSGQHLARVFRQAVGASPREYRASSRSTSTREDHERIGLSAR
jgi:AraC-like DNA-binding protein/mannose-6-phosphate isomerase-like protein (cupin superfamily)